MKSKNRAKLKRPCAEVKPKLQAGAGMWLLLFCEHGHYLRSIRRGEWTDARRKYGRKRARVKCGRCGRENGNGRTH